MIRIVFLISSLHRGGAEKQLTLLVRGLDHSVFHCTVVTIYAGGELDRELNGIENVDVLSIHKGGRRDSIAALVRLGRLILGLKPNIVHGYLDSSNVLALITGKLARSRVVWGVRSSSLESMQLDLVSRLYRRLGASLSSRADVIVSNSTAGREYAIDIGYPAERIVTIPNGFETDRFQPNLMARFQAREGWGIAAEMPVVGLIARLDPVKDHPTFLHAAALLALRMPEVRFVCVGGGGSTDYERSLKQLAKDLSLDKYLIWAGETADMPAAYNGLDIASLVSTSEGFANAVGEAMSCGVPCVVTDVGDSRDIVGDAGIVVQPGDPNALCEAWQALLALSPTEIADMRSRARARIVESYSEASLVERTSRLLLSLVDDTASQRTHEVDQIQKILGRSIE